MVSYSPRFARPERESKGWSHCLEVLTKCHFATLKGRGLEYNPRRPNP